MKRDEQHRDTQGQRIPSIESRRYFMMLGPPPQRKASTAAGPPYVSDVGSRSAMRAFAVSKRSAGFCLHMNKRRRSGPGTTTGLAHAEHAEHAAGHEQPWRRKTGKVGRRAGVAVLTGPRCPRAACVSAPPSHSRQTCRRRSVRETPHQRARLRKCLRKQSYPRSSSASPARGGLELAVEVGTCNNGRRKHWTPQPFAR
jgi:hypothetical protein